MTLLLLPVAAGAIFGVALVWWSASWVVEGYGRVRDLIRTAN